MVADFLDLTSVPSVLTSTLALNCTQKGPDWVQIQRPEFDVVLEDEPFHNLEVLVNLRTAQFLLRIWGKTHQKGTIKSEQQLKVRFYILMH